MEVELLNGLGALQGYQTQPNSECHNPKVGETDGE
jgi:hypothetical protein